MSINYPTAEDITRENSFFCKEADMPDPRPTTARLMR